MSAEVEMPKGAIRVIVIIYGVLLGLMYFAGNPPAIFGHHLEVRLVAERPVPPLPRVFRAIDLRTGGYAADLVCAPVPAALHRIGGY